MFVAVAFCTVGGVAPPRIHRTLQCQTHWQAGHSENRTASHSPAEDMEECGVSDSGGVVRWAIVR